MLKDSSGALQPFVWDKNFGYNACSEVSVVVDNRFFVRVKRNGHTGFQLS